MANKKRVARERITVTVDSPLPSLEVAPPSSFISLTRELGALRLEMAKIGFGGTPSDGSTMTMKDHAGHIDFTGIREEHEAKEETEPVLIELQQQLGISPDKIWSILFEYLPHVRRSEFEHAWRTFKRMKKSLQSEIRKLQLIMLRARRVQIAEIRTRIMREHDLALQWPAVTRAGVIGQTIQSLSKQFRHRGHPSVKKAEAELVGLIIQTDPQQDHTAACKKALKILRPWAKDKAPKSANAIRRRTKHLTIHKKYYSPSYQRNW